MCFQDILRSLQVRVFHSSSHITQEILSQFQSHSQLQSLPVDCKFFFSLEQNFCDKIVMKLTDSTGIYTTCSIPDIFRNAAYIHRKDRWTINR